MALAPINIPHCPHTPANDNVAPGTPLHYVSALCPPGWDTVLGYLAKTNPDLLNIMDRTPEATQRDGYWLTARTRKRYGVEPVKVPACLWLQRQGIETVNAYPLTLLRERLG